MIDAIVGVIGAVLIVFPVRDGSAARMVLRRFREELLVRSSSPNPTSRTSSLCRDHHFSLRNEVPASPKVSWSGLQETFLTKKASSILVLTILVSGRSLGTGGRGELLWTISDGFNWRCSLAS